MARADAGIGKELNKARGLKRTKPAQSSPAGTRALVPAGPARALCGSQNSARRQGFAGAAPNSGAPLPAPRRFAPGDVATGGSGGNEDKTGCFRDNVYTKCLTPPDFVAWALPIRRASTCPKSKLGKP